MSVKTKMIAATLPAVVVFLVGTAFVTLLYFERQFKGIISAVQFTMLTQTAHDIDDKISNAHNALIGVSKVVPPEVLDDADGAQAWLNNRTGIQSIFDNGITLFRPSGRLIAEAPYLPRRRGLNFSFRDYIRETIRTRKPYISRPYLSSKEHGHPAVMLTAPVFDGRGRVIAILAGSLDLMKDNFLGRLATARVGRTGHLFLFTRDRTILIHPDRERIMTRDAGPGPDKLFDAAVDGFEGTGETVTSSGRRSLSSFKALKTKDWILAANYPLSEAYAPISRARRYFYAVLLLAVVISLATVWLTMQRLTAPLLRLTKDVNEIGAGNGPAGNIAVSSRDEIGALAKAFNEMLARLRKKEDELQGASEVLAITNTAVERERAQLKDAVDELSLLLQQVVSEQNISVRFQNPHLRKCFEEMRCARTDCPCFGADGVRCWQAAGTYNGKEPHCLFTREFGACDECPVFRFAASEPIYQIGEQFNNMMHILGTKSAELKTAQSHLLQREKMASLGQLAAGVAHEINNPMGFIMSNLGTLRRYVERLTDFIAVQTEASLLVPAGGEVSGRIAERRRSLKIDYIVEDAKSLINESLDGAERVKRIVQDLKSFSHVDEAASIMADINACLESTINMVWNELKYKAVLTRRFGDIPRTLCNPGQLNQVFVNLLVNAAHAIEKQGEITVRTWRENGSILVAVSDTGCGIARENLNRIFEPFFTTKEVGKGTGLGLSVAYDIIKKHNGRILVESEAGRGTTFTVTLPVVEG